MRQISKNRRFSPVMDLSIVDDKDPVGRGVQRGGEEGQGLAQLVLGGNPRRSVVGGNHVALHGGIVDQVDDAELEGDDGLPVMAEQAGSDGHRMSRRRPESGITQGLDHPPAVGLGHDVGERTHLDEFRIVTEETGDRPRGGLEESSRGHQHDDRPGVVHQGPEASLTASRQLEPSSFRQVTQAEEDEVLAGEPDRSSDDLDQAPTGDGLDADFDGVSDIFVLNGGERPQHQLLVVGVHEAQARGADPVVQRPAEHALRGRSCPTRPCPLRRR